MRGSRFEMRGSRDWSLRYGHRWGKHMGREGGFSLKLLTAFVAFVAGRELFLLYANGSKLRANLVGLALWSLAMYIEPPRPKLWRLLVGTVTLALIVVALHLLHVG